MSVPIRITNAEHIPVIADTLRFPLPLIMATPTPPPLDTDIDADADIDTTTAHGEVYMRLWDELFYYANDHYNLRVVATRLWRALERGDEAAALAPYTEAHIKHLRDMCLFDATVPVIVRAHLGHLLRVVARMHARLVVPLLCEEHALTALLHRVSEEVELLPEEAMPVYAAGDRTRCWSLIDEENGANDDDDDDTADINDAAHAAVLETTTVLLATAVRTDTHAMHTVATNAALIGCIVPMLLCRDLCVNEAATLLVVALCTTHQYAFAAVCVAIPDLPAVVAGLYARNTHAGRTFGSWLAFALTRAADRVGETRCVAAGVIRHMNLVACVHDDLPQVHRHLEVLLLAFRAVPDHRDTLAAMNAPECALLALHTLTAAQQDKSWAPVATIAAALLCHIAVCTGNGVETLCRCASVGTLFQTLTLFWDDPCIVTGVVGTLYALCSKSENARLALATKHGVALVLGRVLDRHATDGTVSVLITSLL
jgi:hypothetical protein